MNSNNGVWYIGWSPWKTRSRNRAQEVKDAGYDLGIGLVPLKDYLTSSIPQSVLDNLDANLSDCEEAEIDTILRFRYSEDSSGIDATRTQALAHIDQLAPVLQKHSGRILTLQAGFIGAWGEWHTSKNMGTLQDRVAITQALLGAFPGIVSIRTPMFVHEMFPRYIPSKYLDLIGIHNDAFMSSSSDMGTYEKPNVTYWRDYAGELALFGGETAALHDKQKSPDLVYEEFQATRCAYLNAQYNMDALNYWKANNMHGMVSALMRENR